jgi:hypothetical protein
MQYICTQQLGGHCGWKVRRECAFVPCGHFVVFLNLPKALIWRVMHTKYRTLLTSLPFDLIAETYLLDIFFWV